MVLDRLKSASITPPTSPNPVPPVMALPPVGYLEHKAAVEKTKVAIALTQPNPDREYRPRSFEKRGTNTDNLELSDKEDKRDKQ